MITSLRDRWHARFGRELLDQAISELGSDRPKRTIRLAIAWVLSVLVLISPLIVFACGVVLIATGFPRILPCIVGLILIGFAYVIWPPRPRNRQKTYRRGDLPELFDLLDQIAAHLGCAPVDGVHLFDEFNAYIAQYRALFSHRQEWIVGIGFPLWAALSPAGRIAVLAHELGHKVNDDPLRQGVFFQANAVLENWHDTFDPDYHGEQEGFFTQTILRKLIGAYSHLLSWFTFFESQRAEYRADAFAARVSGCSALCDMLEMFTRTELIERSVVDLYPYREQQNGRVFDHMAKAVRDADGDTIRRYLQDAAEEKQRVDASHPPTAMRIEFIRTLPETSDSEVLNPAAINFGVIDSELQPMKDELGKELLEYLHETEVNR